MLANHWSMDYIFANDWRWYAGVLPTDPQPVQYDAWYQRSSGSTQLCYCRRNCNCTRLVTVEIRDNDTALRLTSLLLASQITTNYRYLIVQVT